MPPSPSALEGVVPTRRLPQPAAFWSVAALLLLMLAASGVPSPLYRVYSSEFGFGPGMLTTIFAVYAFALLGSLMVVGGLSDHVGRRPVIAAAFALEAVAMLLFLAADGVGWLLAARVVQGLATGALTSALGAWLLDLQRRERPLGALINSASPGIGLSVGAVGAGLLVQWVPFPTEWTFGVLAALFALAVPGVLLLPESSARMPGALASLRPRVQIPQAHRQPFMLALPVVVAAWALAGLYASLGPSLVADVFGVDNHVVGSLLILALNGTSVLGSLAVRGANPDKALIGGALTFAVGVAGTITAVPAGSLPLLFAAGVVTGFGFGASFFGAIAMITAGVAPGYRAGLLAGTCVVGYLGFSVPAIAAGIAVGSVGLARTTEVYGCAVLVLALLAAGSVALRRRRAAPPDEVTCPESEELAA
jgi:hypothetical protein